MRLQTITLLLMIAFLPGIAYSQVKIGDPTGPVDPKAVLELKDTTRGLLLPRMTNAHMNAITTPPDGLLIYNNTAKSIYQYHTSNSLWQPLRSDSSDWFLDTASKRLYLKYGLTNDDTIYYQTQTKKFIFADTRYFTGSTGVPFNLDEGNSDKHVFKVTASKFPRSMPNLNSANIYAVYEVDADTAALNNPYQASYSGIGVATVANASSTQRISDLIGVNVASGNAGQDTVLTVYGIFNNAYTRGNSFTETLMGQANFISAGGTNNANIGEMYGNFINLSYSTPTATRRILGSVYGQYININSSLLNKVDGFAYGVYIPPVRASSSGNNFALFTMKGHNHLADSTLITDGGALKPRAVLDVNATSAMIIPTGLTFQRPVTSVVGMFRYNSETTSVEVNRSTGWVGLANVYSNSVTLDPTSIASGATGTVTVAFTGATTSSTVSISPAAALPSGYMIAYARVSSAGFVEVGFANFSGAPIDLVAQPFMIKVIQ